MWYDNRGMDMGSLRAATLGGGAGGREHQRQARAGESIAETQHVKLSPRRVAARELPTSRRRQRRRVAG